MFKLSVLATTLLALACHPVASVPISIANMTLSFQDNGDPVGEIGVGDTLTFDIFLNNDDSSSSTLVFFYPYLFCYDQTDNLVFRSGAGQYSIQPTVAQIGPSESVRFTMGYQLGQDDVDGIFERGIPLVTKCTVKALGTGAVTTEASASALITPSTVQGNSGPGYALDPLMGDEAGAISMLETLLNTFGGVR